MPPARRGRPGQPPRQINPAQGSIDFDGNRSDGYPAARLSDPDTSHEAAVGDDRIRQFRRGMALMILGEVAAAGTKGVTVDEVAARHPEHDRGTLARRMSDLRDAQLVIDSGRRRLTRRNCKAIVWIEAGRDVPPPTDELTWAKFHAAVDVLR